jgi:hypothetical protein
LPSEFSKSIGLTLCGRRADLAFAHPLPEIAERHVAPDVAIEIDQDRIGARERVAIFGDAVVRLDLRRIRTEFEAKARNGFRRKPFPLDVGIRDHMRVVVADRAVQLALDRDFRKRGDLPAEPRIGVRELLAERGRRRGLAVRARQHRRSGVRMRELAQVAGERLERRQQHRLARFRKRDAVREVVDVFRRAREVNELRHPRDFGNTADALLEPVLDGLDIMVRRALDCLDARCILLGKRCADLDERRSRSVGKCGNLADRRLVRKRPQPGDFDADALADQRKFAETTPQRVDLGRVPAVERRQRGQAGVFGGVHVAKQRESLARVDVPLAAPHRALFDCESATCSTRGETTPDAIICDPSPDTSSRISC